MPGGNDHSQRAAVSCEDANYDVDKMPTTNRCCDLSCDVPSRSISTFHLTRPFTGYVVNCIQSPQELKTSKQDVGYKTRHLDKKDKTLSAIAQHVTDLIATAQHNYRLADLLLASRRGYM